MCAYGPAVRMFVRSAPLCLARTGVFVSDFLHFRRRGNTRLPRLPLRTLQCSRSARRLRRRAPVKMLPHTLLMWGHDPWLQSHDAGQRAAPLTKFRASIRRAVRRSARTPPACCRGSILPRRLQWLRFWRRLRCPLWQPRCWAAVPSLPPPTSGCVRRVAACLPANPFRSIRGRNISTLLLLSTACAARCCRKPASLTYCRDQQNLLLSPAACLRLCT